MITKFPDFFPWFKMKFPDFSLIFSKNGDFPWLSLIWKRDFEIPWFSLIFPDAGHPEGVLNITYMLMFWKKKWF